MKIIVEHVNQAVRFVFNDNDVVEFLVDKINGPDITIFGLGSGNSTLMENIELPLDWAPSKYCYTQSGWEVNPAYVSLELSSLDPIGEPEQQPN